MILRTLALTTLLFVVSCSAMRRPRYVWGDALSDPEAPGLDGSAYPRQLVNSIYSNGGFQPLRGHRQGRTFPKTMDPEEVRNTLLRSHVAAKTATASSRESAGRSMSSSTGGDFPPNNSNAQGCRTGSPGVPARMCATQFNTTAPMYGVSLTSGQPVTIVQKFPDLLQQVIFEVCESDSCDIVQGSCVQTYIPYLFLVIPLGPVTLTGQDYVLVESGCECQPKYSLASSATTAFDVGFDQFG